MVLVLVVILRVPLYPHSLTHENISVSVSDSVSVSVSVSISVSVLIRGRRKLPSGKKRRIGISSYV
jgi:hypothetical protein